MRIGIDIGGVIIGGASQGQDTIFTDEYLQTPEVSGALEAIARLVTEGSEVFIVSKCGPKVQARSMEWLEDKSFFASTGVLRERVRFCRSRKEKGPIAQELGLDLFVDDREDVLKYMPQSVVCVLFGAERASFGVRPAPGWEQVLRVVQVEARRRA